MKNFSLLFLLLVSHSLFARNIIALTNDNAPGDWSNGATWSSGDVPSSGDVVTIPSGKAVAVTTQVYGSSTPTLFVTVNGTLNFEPSGKLTLSATSYIQISVGGKISPKNNAASQMITIGGILKYSASNNGIVVGPATADILSGISVPTQPLSGFNPYLLPLQLLSFTASKYGAVVMISWKVAGQASVEKFELEKSTGDNKWTKVGERVYNVDSYQAEDMLVAKGSNFYRLKIIQTDGRYTYSATIQHVHTTNQNLAIYPNPASQNVFVSLPNIGNGKHKLDLINNRGTLVKEYELQAGQASLQIAIDGLAKGFYFIRIMNDQEVIATRKLIVE